MAVAIEKRPIGVVLNTGVSANINQDYSSAFATVNSTAHGLSDGMYVYIKCNVENYNGFWRIDVRNANEFLLIDNPYVAWIVDANITYYPQISTHGWSCAHLPIVYELSNTLWPVNSVDTTRTISSISNDNGYLNLNLSGSLGTFEDLSFVKISNAPNSDYNGVYYIIDKLATNDVTVNALFSTITASGITGASIQLYYSSYNIVVRVYAGLNASHEWASVKPYELAATLELIPDEDNRVKFSINDILKAYVETKNNLLLPSLPLNTDAFTQFYIEVAEQYDTSNGYTITTFEGGFASDQSTFEGYAANSMLAFKNIHSGYLSEYVMTNNTAKFLTLFAIPVLFQCSDDEPNCYQDISFIQPGTAQLTLQRQWYLEDVLQATDSQSVDQNDQGIYRVPLEADCTYDRVDIALLVQPVMDGLSSFTNVDTGGPAWTTGAAPSASVGSGLTSDNLVGAFTQVEGVYTYTINYTFTRSGGFNDGDIRLLDASNNTLGTSGSLAFNSGSGSIQITSDGSAPLAKIALRYTAIGSTSNVTVNALTVSQAQISETKEFAISCGCSNQEIRLGWQNNLGGFDYWKFTGETDHVIDITAAGETRENIFPEWPNSYGETADTIRKQTFRESTQRKFVFSQFLTREQADAIAYIKSSPLVQIVNSRTDKRTVIVDTDSFSKYTDGSKTYTISFNILYTDDIPSQRV